MSPNPKNQPRSPGTPPADITELLIEFSSGNASALEALVPKVQLELVRLARKYMRRERPGHTLEPTALVNEAFLSLMGQNIQWENRSHFYAVAALAMRQALVAYARRRNAQKRGASQVRVTLNEDVLGKDEEDKIIALHEALDSLGKDNPRQAKVVELKYFGGLGVDEIGEVLGVSPRTVKRDWLVAKSWLAKTMLG